MNELEPEILLHTFGSHCLLCASKWLRAQPQETRDKYVLTQIKAQCQEKKNETN